MAGLLVVVGQSRIEILGSVACVVTRAAIEYRPVRFYAAVAAIW